MSPDILKYIGELEARIRMLESSQSQFNAPGWKDITEIHDKMEATDEQVELVKFGVAKTHTPREEIQKMIDASNKIQSQQIGNSFAKVFADPEWREGFTSDVVKLLRDEMQVSMGSASNAASAAKSVARANIDNSVQLLRSRSYYFARG